MIKRRLGRRGLTFLAFGLQLLSLQAWGDDFWASIPGDYNTPFVAQHKAGDSACVPTAMLYMFKLGPEPVRAIYNSLPGSTDLEKLNFIVTDGLALPTTVEEESRKFVFSHEFGTNILDNQTFIEDLARETQKPVPPLSYRLANRYMDETSPGRLVRRLHSMILNSVENSYPVITGVDIRSVDFDEKVSKSVFAHAVVITDVQKLIPKGDLGFMIQYLDPNTGIKKSAMIYEEINTPFNASIIDRATKGGQYWSRGKYGVYNFDNEFVSSPYLKISAPNLIPHKQIEWNKKVDAFVTNFILYTK